MNSKLAQVVIAAVQELMETKGFELRSDNWFELKIDFKFELNGAKIKRLDLGDVKILKKPKKRTKRL